MTIGDSEWTNYRIEATVTIEDFGVSDNGGCGIIARFKESEEPYVLKISGSTPQFRLSPYSGVSYATKINAGVPHHIALEVREDRIVGILEDDALLDEEPLDGVPTSGQAGLFGDLGVCFFQDVRVIACDD